jgi:hypothetical protein
MLLARLVCSDPRCHDEREIAVDDLDRLDGLVCECGHGFVLVSVSELREPAATVIPIEPRDRGIAPPPGRRAA